MFVPAFGADNDELELTVIFRVLAGPLPQKLLPATDNVPEVAVAEKLAIIELVPLPDAIVKPVPV